jgi:VanZ family protein
VDERDRKIDAVLWAAAILCGALTLWLSFWVVPPGTSAFGGADKAEHALAYFVTTLLVLLAAVWRPGRGEGVLWRWRVWVVAGMVVAGGVVEVVQASVGRDGEVADWLVEVVAVALAVVAVSWMRSREHARSRDYR